MLLHLIPKLSNTYLAASGIKLLDLFIPELKLSLVGGKDLVAGRPYPNKAIYVARKKRGRLPTHGLLIETDRPVERFSMIVRWEDSMAGIYKHVVTFFVADDDHDAVSMDMTLWGLQPKAAFENRHIFMKAQEGSPMMIQPRIDTRAEGKGGCYEDRWHKGGHLERIEVFVMPTIERARLWSPGTLFGHCMPQPQDILNVKVKDYVPPSATEWPANGGDMDFATYLGTISRQAANLQGIEDQQVFSIIRKSYYSGRDVSAVIRDICA